MVAEPGMVLVPALASPVTLTEGGNGEGSTPEAVAPPALVTTICAVNDWPRVSVAGRLKEVTDRLDGVCTSAVPVVAVPVDTVRLLTASVPEALAENCSVPAPVPFSTNVQLKVVLAPGFKLTATGDEAVLAAAPPVALI